MGNEVYKFICTVEYEKFFSDSSYYGAYNVTVNTLLPYAQEYKGFEDLFGDNRNSDKIYFINLAGKMQRLYIGCKYEVVATLEFNNKYNCWQYLPKTIKGIKPSTFDDNKKFLSSILTNIQAETLLNVYPDIIERIINNEEIDLSKTKGIKEITFTKIKDKVMESYGISDLLIMLQPLGITLKTIEKIKSLESNIEILKERITENPYILTDIKGLGFKKVDGIANKINPNIKVSYERTVSFLKYYFQELGNSTGDTWCNLETLKDEINNNIPECESIYTKIIDKNIENPTLLYIQDDIVGLKYTRNTELRILDLLNDINTHTTDYSFSIDCEYKLSNTQMKQGFEYTEEQKSAIASTLENGVTIITAKGGTGKTTCINGIVNMYDNLNIALCSLSAKASRRMTEVTGKSANTIHKLLGFGQSTNKDRAFLYNEDNMLPYDIIIIDEASMISADIFLSLLQAIKPTSKVIIVFDNGQLPPIGYGNIANDLLSYDFNIKRLNKVHRQAEKSGILADANKIREQIYPIENPATKEIHGELKDMCYMFRDDREQIRDIMIKQYVKSIENYGIENCVIIVPRKKDCINSIREINNIIQDRLIDNSITSINRGDTVFRIGARVIQKVNDGEKGVINGELGYIYNIWKNNGKEYFNIKFDDNKIIEYTRDGIMDIELGYCLTIHSCQGSEYDMVIVGIDNTHYSLLSSNLLYTAITRGKKKCLLVAETQAFKRCLRIKSNNRNTWLQIK